MGEICLYRYRGAQVKAKMGHAPFFFHFLHDALATVILRSVVAFQKVH